MFMLLTRRLHTSEYIMYGNCEGLVDANQSFFQM